MSSSAQLLSALQGKLSTNSISQSKTSDASDKLDSFSKILDEVVKTNPQAVTTTLKQTEEKNLNPSNPVSSAKEKLEVGKTLDTTSIDVSGAQVVEIEKNPEIPVEVESFLHRVEDHVDQAPQEIVIADGTVETTNANYPTTPVVILPITKQEEKKGKRKSTKHSFRWLVEWSHKIIKLFAGKVIYRQEENKDGV